MNDFADLAAGMQLGAIEPTSYYFAEASNREMARYRGRCTRLGLDVSGTAIANNFCTRDAGKLKKEIAHVKRWIELASVLGAKTIRIFAGSLEKGDAIDAARPRVVAAIEECCDFASRHGIYLALENHGGITATAEGLLALVQAVKSDWFGVNLDTGNFRTKDPYGDLERLAPYAVVVQVKTDVQPLGQPKQPADLPRVLSILRKAGYRGYVALEYEGAEEPRTAIPAVIAKMKKLMA
jgi:sugar phosphate isomerase/epimerase